MVVVRSIVLFALAGLCEIGGGYLFWLWLRRGKGIGFAVVGAVILVLYGVIPTFQPAHFGRVYAAYGGVFIVMALLWSWAVDRIRPDAFDLVGGAVCILGVGIIMYWPRG